MTTHIRRRSVAAATAVLLTCAVGAAAADPVKTHPRLWLRSADIPELQSRMTPSNPVWVTFSGRVQAALNDWLTGKVPGLDDGSHTGNGNPYKDEHYAMLFAFMSLLETDPTMKQTYIDAARDCLMWVMDQASLGPGTPNANGQYPPFRHPGFILADRGFGTEAFALAVDWLQAHPNALSAADMGKIRKTFLWWGDEANKAVYFSPYNPNGLVNDPALLRLAPPAPQDVIDKRWAVRNALNNHYANRLKMMILMPLALDPADDVPVAAGDSAPPGALTGYVVGANPDDWVYVDTGYLRLGTGAWLYLTDYGLRHDGAGGGSQEGFQYMTNGLGPTALAMLMLHTAGQDDPNQWGPQVVLAGHPFWDRAVGAYLHQLTPATRLIKDNEYRGSLYELPWFGDGEQYSHNDQFIKLLGPLAMYDYYRDGTTAPRTQTVRYIQKELAPGGAGKLADRIYNTYSEQRLRDAIAYLLLFDPDAPPPSDPRPTLAKTEFQAFNDAATMGAIHARTANGPNEAYFDYRLGWNLIDHQHGDGNSFEFWRNGVWLTKRWIGYGSIAANSDYNNAMTIQNNPLPASNTFYTHQTANRHGSQYAYSQQADPTLLAKSLGQNFLYVSGEAAPLYNLYNQSQNVDDVVHAVRDIVWLKPEFVVVYDRAETGSAGRFKRFHLALPSLPQLTGSIAHVTVSDTHYTGGVLTSTPKAEFYSTTLLPAGAAPAFGQKRQMTNTCQLPGGTTVDCDLPEASQCLEVNPVTGRCDCPAGGCLTCTCRDETAASEPMNVLLTVAAPGDPANTRFLHVLQGSDVGVAAAAATLVESSAGNAYQGAVVGQTAVLFPVDTGAAFGGLTYSVPAATESHLVTGLAPATTYYVTQQVSAGDVATQIATAPGGTPVISDSGGVLVIGPLEPASVSIAATDAVAAEAGVDPAVFTVVRSGSIAAALDVHYTLGGTATNGDDYVALSGTVTIPANSAAATITLTPVDDTSFEGEENVTVTLAPDAAYAAAGGVDSAAAVIADDDPPPGGFLQFSAPTFGVAENGAVAHATVTRTSGSQGSVSVQCSAGNGTALAGADFQATSQTLSWGPGDTQPKDCAVTILDDQVYEDDETVVLTLGAASGQAALGTPSTATLTIVEDEPAPVGQIVLGGAAFTTNETGQVQVTVKRVNGKGGPASVSYATADGSATAGSDYTPQSGTLTWNDLENFDQTITIPIVADDLFEGGNETFTLSLSGATIPLGAPSSATVTVVDDDPQPLEYDVGPGWPFATIGAVPWQALVAGSIVRIHGEGSPYHEKFLISSRGSAAQPIQVLGIPGPNGEPVVIDGANATSSGALHYVSELFTESHSVVAVARDSQDASTFKPGYIDIENLEVRNAAGSFTTTAGQTQAYSSFAAAILIQGAEHVTVRGCVVHDSANGILVESRGSESDVSRDVVLAGNHAYANGWVGYYNGRNIAVDAVGALVEENRLDTPANGGNGANLEARAAGTVLRYNRVEGGAPMLQIADSGSAVVRADAGYADAVTYGNLLLDGSNNPGTLVRFGGDSGNTANYRTGTLYFFHNTAVIESTTWEPAVFGLPSGAQGVDARNNIFYRAPAGVAYGSIVLRLLPTAGTATLGANWIVNGWQPVGNVVYDPGEQVVGSDPGFASYAGGDFHLTSGAAARDYGGALSPVVVGVHDVTRQYVAPTASEPRPLDGAPDLGAFEYGVPPPTPTPSPTPTSTPTQSATSTPTGTPTHSATSTPAASATWTPAWTPTPVPTATPTQTPAPTDTPTPTATPTASSTPPSSATPTATPTRTPTPKKGKGRLAMTAQPFRLVYRGSAIVPKPWAGVAPVDNGVRVTVDGVLDAVIPGGAVVAGTGWAANPLGTKWRYTDRLGTHGGVTRIRLSDRSHVEDGLVRWSVRAAGPSAVLPAPDQVHGAVVLGDAAEAVVTTWSGPFGPAPRCRGTNRSVRCG